MPRSPMEPIYRRQLGLVVLKPGLESQSTTCYGTLEKPFNVLVFPM